MKTTTRKHLSPLERREQIVMAADAVLQRVGVNDFTIDKVIESLGIAKGTVYKYFETKDDVLAEVSIKALNQLLNYFKLSERNSPEGIEKTRAVIMSCYYFGQDQSRYFELLVYMERPEFLTISDAYLEISNKLTNWYSSHIASQQEKGHIRKDIEPLVANYMTWGSCMGVMQFLDAKRIFIENNDEITQKQLMEAYVDVMIKGMGA
ncbi:TetR/AcrR family transcriptional regulator [Aquimarina sp. U1-2]|uniref:TetR/AcrR family transcriptional regulator n=1 Tax=Aquimarina sp. U1-2 TaxID=2823141 RepID=UPI001AECD9B4|nr:TetR/AcrR family transcriptional regulator [Aquimarina sp. U1-2]MBP2831084.1 TetR/AcrR family transcriptional regulator [Aquimarina sp. U1-2]